MKNYITNHMMKKIIKLAILFVCIPLISYGGYGPFAEEQVGLLEECRKWAVGDSIPNYLLFDGSHFNQMGGHTPSYYIAQIRNVELLIAVSISAKAPYGNRIQALKSLQSLLSLKDLREYFLSF